MGRVIDDRVVEMRFDNKDFEKNVSQSLSTLDKLKSALKIGNSATSEFDNVMDAAGDLGNSFSALENIAVGAFRRMGAGIYEWAVNTIMNLSGVKNILEGWRKYETITDSMATLHYQGFTDEETEAELKRLNWFTDETSYNLSDMVDNITKFTAAGKGLHDSADAMMGIALWAASAGQQSGGASRAMYQLSQAIGRSMKLEDWKSIQNLNMDTRDFREAVLATAVEMKTLKKNSDGTYRSLVATSKAGKEAFNVNQFADSLTQGQWFTSDVQMAIYKKYAGAIDSIFEYYEQHEGDEGISTVSDVVKIFREKKLVDEWALSAFEAAQEARTWTATVESVKDAMSTGWMNVFQHFFGTYQDAKEFFTQLANDLYIFVEPINAFNDVLDEWVDLGGREDFLSGLISLLHVVRNLLYMVGDAISAVFRGKDTAKGLAAFSAGFRMIAGELEEFSKHTTTLQWTLSGIFALIDLALQPLVGLLRAISSLFGGTAKVAGYLNEGIFGITGGIGWLLVQLDNLIKDGDVFYKVFSFLLKPIVLLKNGILKLIDVIIKTVPKAWKIVKSFFANLGKQIYGALPGIWNSIKGYFKQLLEASGELGRDLEKVFAKIGRKIKELFGLLIRADFKGFFESIRTTASRAAEIMASYWEKARPYVMSFYDGVASYTHAAIDKITQYWEQAKPYIKKFFKDAKDWSIEAVKTIGETWGKAKKAVVEFYNTAKDKFYEVSGLKPGELTSKLKEALGKAKETLLKFLDWAQNNLGGFWSVIKKIFTEIAKFFGKIAGGIASFITSSDFEKPKKILKAFWETIKVIAMGIGAVFYGLYKLLEPILGDLKLLFHNLLTSTDMETVAGTLQGVGMLFTGLGVSKIGGFFGSITDTLNNFSDILKGNPLKQAAKAILILAIALFVLAKVPFRDLVKSEGAFMTIATFIGNGMAYLSNVVGAKGMLSVAKSLKDICFGLLMIAAALFVLSKIEPKKLWSAVGALSVMIVVIAGAMYVIARYLPKVQEKGLMLTKSDPNGKKSHMLAGTILAIGLSLIMLAAALKILSTIDGDEMKVAIGGLLFGVLILVGAMWAIDKVAKNLKPSTASAVLIMAISFVAIGLVLKMLSGIEWEQMAVGMQGLIVCAVALAAVGVIVGKFGNQFKPANGAAMLLLALSFIPIAAAMAILALTLGRLDEDQFLKTIIAFGIAAVAMIVIGAVIGQAGGYILAGGAAMLAIGAAFVLIAIAMVAISGAVAIFGSMDIGVLKQGIIAVGVLIAGIALLSNLANPVGLLALAASLVIMGQALIIFTGIVATLGLMSVDTLKQGGIALAIFFGAILLAGAISLVVGPGLLVLSAALLALGAATIMTGIGLNLINKGFKALYKNLHMIDPVVNGLFDGLLAFTMRLPELIEPLTAFLAMMLVSTLKIFVDNIPMVVNAIVEFITVVLETIAYGDGLDRILDAFWTLVEKFLWGLEGHLQSIVESLGNMVFDIVLGIIEAVTDRIGELIDKLLEMFVAIIEGLATAIDNNAQAMVDAVEHLKIALLRFFLLAITGGYLDIYAAGEEGGNQTYQGFKDKINSLFSTIGSFLKTYIVDPIVSFFKDPLGAIKDLIDAGKEIVNGLLQGIKDAWDQIWTWISGKLGGLVDKVKEFFGISSPSKLMATLGGYIGEGFGIGIRDSMSYPMDAVSTMSDNVLGGFMSLTDQINGLLANNIETSPTITPVLDLTNLKAGSSSINSMFGGLDLGSGKMNLAALASGFDMSDSGFDPNDPNSGRMVFNQYNYSPKALTPTEIYRQTRNQLSGAKGVVIRKR